MSGWIKLHRSFKDWDWYKSSPTKDVFIHILLSVKYEQSSYKGLTLTAGQMSCSRVGVASDTGLTVAQVREALKRLEKSKTIDIQTSRKGTIITVLNWEKHNGQTTQETSLKKPESHHKNNPKNNPPKVNTKKVNIDSTTQDTTQIQPETQRNNNTKTTLKQPLLKKQII